MHIFYITDYLCIIPTDGRINVSSIAGNRISNETDTNSNNDPTENPTSATEIPNNTTADFGDVNNGSDIAWI